MLCHITQFTDRTSTLLRHKLLQIKDAFNSVRHIMHDAVWLHQRGVEPEVPVPVEHSLFDAVAGIRRDLFVGVVDPRADQDRLTGSGRGQRQLALPMIVALLHLGQSGGGPCGGDHLSNGFSVLPSNSLVQVAVV